MKRLKIIAILLFSLLLSCTSSDNSRASGNQSSDPSFGTYDLSRSNDTASADKKAASAEPPSVKQDDTKGGGDGSAPNAPVTQKISLDQTADTQNAPVTIDRKIIRNAELSLEAESPESSQQKITAIVESKGGFVVESQATSSDVKTTEHDIVRMTVRVPAEKFNETLGEIRKSATRVIVENVKGQDVTEEFIDIEARLKAERALEAQFIEIMKRATSVQDALNVQRQLADVRGEIEKIEGRKRFLENQSSLSTIKIQLQTPTVFAASSTGFFYRLGQSFSTGFDFALNFVLGLVTFVVAIIPFAVIIGLPMYFIVRYFWRRQTRPKSFGDIAKEELESE